MVRSQPLGARPAHRPRRSVQRRLARVLLPRLIRRAVLQRGTQQARIGIRVAVGAQSRQIHPLVLGHAARLSLLGCAAGLFCLWPALHVTRALRFGVEPGDPLTFAFVPALLVVIGLLAASIPALKAGRIDPAEMLRVE